jgi:hypothetical protein
MNRYEKYFLLLGLVLQFLFFPSIAIAEKFFFVTILILLYDYFNNLFITILISFLFDLSTGLPIGSSALILMIYQLFLNFIYKYFHFRGISNRLIICFIFFLITTIYFYLQNPQLEVNFFLILFSFLYFLFYLFALKKK